ncbi:hypothetical protein BD324DRAFT_649227 [Kockovaella imperatae]|uniref:ABM domain-containing protein n=1 Tax=Kockovaella imperatae TaxID=4999 RepID=A0A1Y1UM57_9TREE|nr:hypothetical protein BD324DRAFT_649227 [Kockovaella imperatae]ORX39138.1 hypothetical protein BD324DRAFT_649227 [Kockovaella imperatae]
MPMEKPEWKEVGGPDSWNIPPGEFTVFGTVWVWPEHAEHVNILYSKITSVALADPGTVYYCISRDQDDPAVFHFFERYQDRASFDAHNEHPLVKELLASGWTKDIKAVFAKAVEGQ